MSGMQEEKSPEPERKKEKQKRNVGTLNDEMSTKEAYFASLKTWVHNATVCQNAMTLFPWYLLHTYPEVFQHPLAAVNVNVARRNATTTNPGAGASSTTATSPGNINPGPTTIGLDRNGLRLRILSDQAQSEFIARNGGYEYVVAPFWKRIAAEIIDTLLLLTLKIFFIFSIMNLFDVKFVFQIDKYAFQRNTKDDENFNFLLYSLDLFAFSSDLMFLEFATKFVVCIYEALWTLGRGATPGKAVMGLSIRYVEAVHALPQNEENIAADPPPAANPFFPVSLLSMHRRARISLRVLLFPGEVPNFQRALMRALCKSIITTILFPMFFLMVFMKNNRTVYDIMTKTIVVENPPEPPTLRRNLQ